MAKRGGCHEPKLHAIRDAAVVLTPSHFVCVLVKVLAADPVMDAVFRPGAAD